MVYIVVMLRHTLGSRIVQKKVFGIVSVVGLVLTLMLVVMLVVVVVVVLLLLLLRVLVLVGLELC